MLVDIRVLESEQKKLAEIWVSCGLLAAVPNGEQNLVAESQLRRLLGLSKDKNRGVDSGPVSRLFADGRDVHISTDTALYASEDESIPGIAGSEIALQMLPKLLDKENTSDHRISNILIDLPGNSYKVATANPMVQKRISELVQRLIDSKDIRSTLFSKSASYMGSKAALSGLLGEIALEATGEDATIVDLMCGSGAAAGAFSHFRRVIASDAQAFATHLAIVQGGGMTISQAHALDERVLSGARGHFELLRGRLSESLDKEMYFLTTEITPNLISDFSDWIKGYPRVGRESFESSAALVDELFVRRKNGNESPYILFSRYYANLFFGVRQAAEIDSLRWAVESIEDGTLKNWALGALICAVSACAYTYGGHFAQPRLDPDNADEIAGQIRNIFLQRSQSVFQEFSVRLMALASESQRIAHPVSTVEGPWRNALEQLERESIENVLVYIDPPYTRDEYSRYYHVLESLVRYDYPKVSGKAAVPIKGEYRFASEFSTRKLDLTLNLHVSILKESLLKGWACLWSYSTGGTVSIASVLDGLGGCVSDIEIYSAKYAYKAQGKGSAKSVTEYFVLLKPKTLAVG